MVVVGAAGNNKDVAVLSNLVQLLLVPPEMWF